MYATAEVGIRVEPRIDLPRHEDKIVSPRADLCRTDSCTCLGLRTTRSLLYCTLTLTRSRVASVKSRLIDFVPSIVTVILRGLVNDYYAAIAESSFLSRSLIICQVSYYFNLAHKHTRAHKASMSIYYILSLSLIHI